MGVKLMPLPEEPFIRFAGRLSDQERLQALEAATVVVVPSPYESLSLLALEAFRRRHADARQRAQRGPGRSLPEEQRRTVLRRPRRVHRVPEAADRRSTLRAAMGRNGREYVRQNYRWDVIIAKYEKMFGTLERLSRYASVGPRSTPAAARRRPVHRGRLSQPRIDAPARPGPVRLRRGTDVVALDHLVERRRLDLQQLGGALLHAAGRSSADSIRPRWNAVSASRYEMPSGGTTNCGIWKRRLLRT